MYNYFKFIILFIIFFATSLSSMCNYVSDFSLIGLQYESGLKNDILEPGISLQKVYTEKSCNLNTCDFNKYLLMDEKELFTESFIDKKLSDFLNGLCSGENIPKDRFLGPLYIKRGLEDLYRSQLMERNNKSLGRRFNSLDNDKIKVKEEIRDFLKQVFSAVEYKAGEVKTYKNSCSSTNNNERIKRVDELKKIFKDRFLVEKNLKKKMKSLK